MLACALELKSICNFVVTLSRLPYLDAKHDNNRVSLRINKMCALPSTHLCGLYAAELTPTADMNRHAYDAGTHGDPLQPFVEPGNSSDRDSLLILRPDNSSLRRPANELGLVAHGIKCDQQSLG